MTDKRPMPLTGEERIAEHPQLGKPLDNFPSRRLKIMVTAWSILISISVLINVGTWNIQADWLGLVIVPFTGILALGLGWWVLGWWNREVILYEHGFTYREGSQDVPFIYAEVRAILLRAEELAFFGGLLRQIVYEVTVITRANDQMRVTLWHYRRADDFGSQLMAQVYPLLRARIQATLQQGESVSFGGGLSLTQAGLYVSQSVLQGATEDAHLAWADYGGLSVKNRQLQLLNHERRVWFALPLQEIENLLLLRELLKQYQTPQAETPAQSGNEDAP